VKKYEESFEMVALKLGFEKKEIEGEYMYKFDSLVVGLEGLINFLCSFNGHSFIIQNCKRRGWRLKFTDSLRYIHFEKVSPKKETEKMFHSAYFQLQVMELFLETFELDNG